MWNPSLCPNENIKNKKIFKYVDPVAACELIATNWCKSALINKSTWWISLFLSPSFRWGIRYERRGCQLLNKDAHQSGVSAPVGRATPSPTHRAMVTWWHPEGSCWNDPWRVEQSYSPKQTLLWLRISHSNTAASQRSQRSRRRYLRYARINPRDQH